MTELPPPVSDSQKIEPAKRGWSAVTMGPGISRCFAPEERPNLAFPGWKVQAKSRRKWKSGQACVQENLCTDGYEQVIPPLAEPRTLYTLGPHVSVAARGAISDQPYTFGGPDYHGPATHIGCYGTPWYCPLPEVPL